jgi:hypothetical protein
MSALGPKRTCALQKGMSALPLKANQKADIGDQWFRYVAPKRVT